MSDIEESINALENIHREMTEKGETPSQELLDILTKLSVMIS
jgi:hypothetical protein